MYPFFVLYNLIDVQPVCLKVILVDSLLER